MMCIMDRDTFNRLLWLMRGAAPSAFVAAIILAGLNFCNGSILAFGICSFCAGVLLVLSWIEWNVLKPM